MPDNTIGWIDLHYLVNNSNSKVSNSIQVKENSNQFNFSLLGSWSSNFATGYSIVDWIGFLSTENWKFLLLLLLMFFLMSWCSSSLSWSSTVVFVARVFTVLRMKWVILVAGGVCRKRGCWWRWYFLQSSVLGSATVGFFVCLLCKLFWSLVGWEFMVLL